MNEGAAQPPQAALAWVTATCTIPHTSQQHARTDGQLELRTWATAALAHEQHWGGGVSQAGFSHWSSHLGLAQLVGFTHLLVQSSCSQTGAHFGGGAVQVVWQRAGWQTVSHLGQPSFSHDSLGQRMEHTGRSQCTTHLAQGV